MRKFLITFFAVVMVVAASLIPASGNILLTQPVLAGTNGQQIQIQTSRFTSDGKSGYKALEVRFTGTNQKGQTFTYKSSFSPTYERKFNGVWWKGRLLANVYVLDLSTNRRAWVSCYVNVPVVQSSNYTRIRFSYSSCWQ